MRRSNIPDSGRGAFATKDYKPGDVVAIYWCRPVCNLKHPPIVTPHAHRSASLVCSRTPVRDTLPPFETRRGGLHHPTNVLLEAATFSLPPIAIQSVSLIIEGKTPTCSLFATAFAGRCSTMIHGIGCVPGTLTRPTTAMAPASDNARRSINPHFGVCLF